MIQIFTAFVKTGSSKSISKNLNPIKKRTQYIYLLVQVYPSRVLIHISPTGHGGSSAIQKSISKIKQKHVQCHCVINTARLVKTFNSRSSYIHVQAKIPMLHCSSLVAPVPDVVRPCAHGLQEPTPATSL